MVPLREWYRLGFVERIHLEQQRTSNNPLVPGKKPSAPSNVPDCGSTTPPQHPPQQGAMPPQAPVATAYQQHFANYQQRVSGSAPKVQDCLQNVSGGTMSVKADAAGFIHGRLLRDRGHQFVAVMSCGGTRQQMERRQFGRRSRALPFPIRQRRPSPQSLPQPVPTNKPSKLFTITALPPLAHPPSSRAAGAPVFAQQAHIPMDSRQLPRCKTGLESSKAQQSPIVGKAAVPPIVVRQAAIPTTAGSSHSLGPSPGWGPGASREAVNARTVPGVGSHAAFTHTIRLGKSSSSPRQPLAPKSAHHSLHRCRSPPWRRRRY